MNEARSHKIIVGLVVASSLCATLLITMVVMAKKPRPPEMSDNVPSTALPDSSPNKNYVELPPGGVKPITPVADPTATTAPTAEEGKLPPVLYPAPAFSFTQRDGSTVTHKDLVGKVVIADFIFTRCGTICPRMSQQMAMMQSQLNTKPFWDQIRLVSFSVDPDFDTPDVLTAYAKRFDADKTHWLFLTGKRKEIWATVKDGFKLPVSDNVDDGLMPIIHSDRFVLIDADGKIRGYYDGLEAKEFDRLLADAALLVKRLAYSPALWAGEPRPLTAFVFLFSPSIRPRGPGYINQGRALDLSFLPHLNASLNALATVLLLLGVYFIKQKNIPAHKRTMILTFCTSCLFLVFYVIHYVWRATVKGGAHTPYNGPFKGVYYPMLLTHIILAIAVPVLAIMMIRLGLKRADEKHRRLAKFTFPIWLYVSVTGVLIYFMLYHMNQSAQ